MRQAPPVEEVEAKQATLTRRTFWGLLLSTALVPLSSTMIAVALADIGVEMAANPAVLTQWLVNSYLVVAIVLLSPGGKLGDLWGGRRALALGQALFAFGSALGFLGSSVAVLVAARVIMAAGGALIGPATMALLRNNTAAGRRARVFGAFGACMALAAALGPLVGGVLVQAFGWRAIFLTNLPLLAVAVPLVRGLPEVVPSRQGVRFDWLGTGLLGAGLVAVVAASKGEGSQIAAALAPGALLLAAFILWERRAADPVMDPALFRNVPFAAGGSVVALHNLAMYALLFQLPLWFASVMGSSAAEVGRVLLAMMLSMVICSPLGGRLSERLGARTVAVSGTLIALAGLWLLTAVERLATAADAVPALVLFGVGLGLTAAPAQAAALSAVAPGRSGMASGALSTMRYLGGIVGVGALGLVLRDVAQADAAAALAGHRTALWVFCGALLVAVLPASLLPGRPLRRSEEDTPAAL